MTGSGWALLAGGVVIGFFIASIFASTKFWELYWMNKSAKALIVLQEECIKHLEQQVFPRFKVDHEPSGMRVKERLYDQYPNLVKPGTEVIRIDNEEVRNE